MERQTIINMMRQAKVQSANRIYAYKKTANGWQGVSFEQMYANAQALAAYLIKNGVQKGDRIAILAEGSPEWINLELGAICAGAMAVPMSIKLSAEEIHFRLEHSEAKFLGLSGFCAEKAAEAVSKLQHKPKILWLEAGRDTAKAALFAHGSFCFFEDAVREGALLLEDAAIKKELEKRMEASSEDDAIILTYSSGTTGNPKGVLLTNLNMHSNATVSVEMFKVPLNGYSNLLILPCDHAFGHTVGIYAALAQGISVYFVDSRGGPAAMIRNVPYNLQEVKPSFIQVVPALANNFMRKIYANVQARGPLAAKLFNIAIACGKIMYGDGYKTGSLLKKAAAFLPWLILGKCLFFPQIKKALPYKWAVGGGALFDRKVQEFFCAAGIPLYQGYGLSEASPVVGANCPGWRSAKIGTAGRVFPTMQAKIVLDDGTEAPVGTPGELIVKGPNVMKGYFKNEQATKEAIIDGWLHTGDMAFFDKDGFFSVIGRKKALLISNDGDKFSPEEIEEAMTATGSLIAQTLLYCEHKPYTVALIVLDNEALKKAAAGSANSDSLLAQITQSAYAFREDPSYRGLFPKMWQPGSYLIVPEAFETNSALKVVRYKALEKNAADLDYLYTPEGSKPDNPRNRERLAQILQKEGLAQ